jgi:hypothetical protein
MNPAALALALLLTPAPELPPPIPDVALADAARFPGHGPALEWLDGHIAWIESQQALDRVYVRFWAAWLEEAKEARQPWSLLAEAREAVPEGSDGDDQLECLRSLRTLIGPEAYAAGRMPSMVNPKSLWRFRERP